MWQFCLVYRKFVPCYAIYAAKKKKKISIKDFFSKCDQIHRFLRIWSHLLKKSLIENFIFCAVLATGGCYKNSALRQKKIWQRTTLFSFSLPFQRCESSIFAVIEQFLFNLSPDFKSHLSHFNVVRKSAPTLKKYSTCQLLEIGDIILLHMCTTISTII